LDIGSTTDLTKQSHFNITSVLLGGFYFKQQEKDCMFKSDYWFQKKGAFYCRMDHRLKTNDRIAPLVQAQNNFK